MKQNAKNHLVTQCNKLVEARYTLTLYEQRIVLLLASMVEIDDRDFKEYIIDFNDLINFLELKSKGLHTKFKNILKLLHSRTLEINNGENGYLITGWISSAEYNKQEGVVKLCFDKKLKPYLLELRKNFTKQRLGVLIQFKGIYTVRIYGLLKQYEKIGKRDFDLVDFKYILNLEDKYTEYKNFRRRVLVPAQKEFSKKDESGSYVSDINFILKTKRRGRKINSLHFIIIKQNTQSPTVKLKQLTQSQIPQAEAKTPALEALAKHNIKGKTANNYLKTQEQAEILHCVALFEEQKATGRVKTSGAGLLITLLNNRAGQEVKITPKNNIPSIPNTTDGTQLQNWAIANDLPAAPVGLNTFQYRQMLYTEIEKMRLDLKDETALFE